MNKLIDYLRKQRPENAYVSKERADLESQLAETQQALADASRAEADVWRMYILRGGVFSEGVRDKYKEWFGETKLSADDAGQFCQSLVRELEKAEQALSEREAYASRANSQVMQLVYEIAGVNKKLKEALERESVVNVKLAEWKDLLEDIKEQTSFITEDIGKLIFTIQTIYTNVDAVLKDKDDANKKTA